jgi:hypothetical protein
MYDKTIRGVLIKGNKTIGQITREVLAPEPTRLHRVVLAKIYPEKSLLKFE